MDFILDTEGDGDLQFKNEYCEDYLKVKEDDVEKIISIFNKKQAELDAKMEAETEELNKRKNNKIDRMFTEFFEDMHWTDTLVVRKSRKPLFEFDQLDAETGKLISRLGRVDVDKEMKKAVLHPSIEKAKRLPRLITSEKRLRLLRKKRREKTKGPEWYNLPAPEMTEELKNDLKVLKMRSALDPKHFYKKNDMKVLPKYFQVGRIMDSSIDHVNERLTRKQRKRTMVEELMADADFQRYNKRKYKELITEREKKSLRARRKEKKQKNRPKQMKDKAIKNKNNKRNK